MGFLYDEQLEAVRKMHNGCILNGGVGSGKSRTALYYYYTLFGGGIDDNFRKPPTNPLPLYIITTAKKRDDLEWEAEMVPFAMRDVVDVKIDSWQNISKYKDITNSFFIFDENRLTGSGAWVKSFIKIAKSNKWIILSATPGDCWADYIPVFIANGFYKNRTEFLKMHAVYSRYAKYPKIDYYINEGRLDRLRRGTLVPMKKNKIAERVKHVQWCSYDRDLYSKIHKERWNVFADRPIINAAEFCLCLRRCVNSDLSRSLACIEIAEKYKRVIIFYSYDFELEILRGIDWPDGTFVSEWNGHKHEEIGDGHERFVYLVNYAAGSEGWNCITTNQIIFYSLNYSYKSMEQAAGRIDRINTPYDELHYWYLCSHSGIDLAIRKALKSKENFNEKAFLGQNIL